MPYATLLIDLDHTLLDSDSSELAAFRSTLDLAGIPFERSSLETYRHINSTLWKRVESGELRPEHVRLARFESFVAVMGLGTSPSLLSDHFAEALGAHGALYPGVPEMLDQLCSKVRMGLVTNGLSDIQRARIDRLDLHRYFDAIVISAEVGAAKPAREIFDIAFAMLGSPDPTRALMVGDSLTSDIAGGAAYGLDTCWYNPEGLGSAGETSITHEISDLKELPGLVL